MKIQQLFLLCCFLSGSSANRVYVHPFSLFAAENVICETLHPLTPKIHRTLPVAPLDIEVLMPDSRDPLGVDAQKQNITERTAVLAGLSNLLGLRMYLALSRNQQSSNTLLSPFSSFGSLMTFYLGASKTTARMIQLFLGLSSGTDPEDCVYLVDGHKVLKTLQSINSLVDNGPNDEITTHVWTFSRRDAELSEDFVQGTQDFSDTSFIRSVDFSKPEEAEQMVNSFVEKTSGGKVASVFNNMNPSNDLLFLTSFQFQGNWSTAFQPQWTSIQEFHVDETTTVMAPFLTFTGRYHYLNDEVDRCTVVKLSLSNRSHMLIVLPHEGSNLQNIESKLLTDVMSDWYEKLQEGPSVLTLPKFSVSSVTDMHDLLTNMDPVIEHNLLGSQAEFSQLSNSKPFTIDKAINKVTFEMSEDAQAQDRIQAGTPPGLLINRPFFFSIFEKNSNAILILGKINNPTL